MVSIKRVYDKPSDDDGYRVMVDRLWPRGLSKESAKIDQWLKEVGPSNELRKWFNHDPVKFDEFTKKYRQELQTNQAFAELKSIVAKQNKVTLIYSAKDEQHNQAVVIQRLLK